MAANEMSMGDRMPGMVEDIKARMKEMVMTAEKEGKLDKLMQVIKTMGLATDAKALFIAAQGYDATRGVSPDELADKITADPKLVEVIISIAAPGEEEMEEEEMTEEKEMGGEQAVKAKLGKMKESAMSADQEEEDMEDEEAAKAYKSKLMM